MHKNLKRNLIAGFVFFVIFAIGACWTYLIHELQQENDEKSLSNIVIAQASALERQISYSLSATYILAHEVKRNSGQIQNFDQSASDILDTISGIANIQLAPNGVTQYVYPLEGNEKIIGHDLLSDELRKSEALLAINEKGLTLAGPFTLLQGGIGVVGRNPVFLNDNGRNKFWGFATALIYLDDILMLTELRAMAENGYSYEISRPHPDTAEKSIFARSTSDLSTTQYQSSQITVPNGYWTLRMSRPLQPFSITGYFVSFVISAILTYALLLILMQPEKLRQIVREKTRQLEDLAFLDSVTGLDNRRSLSKNLEQLLRKLRPGAQQAAFLVLDLDDFKRINDSMGHLAGDSLLQVVSARLLSQVRDPDFLARLGGDEFGIILSSTQSMEDVQVIANKLINKIEEPIPLSGRTIVISATIGITVFPVNGDDVNSILRNSDLAMYYAKRHGKRQARFFSAEMLDIAQQNLALEQDLRNALDNKELFLLFQPIVSTENRQVCAFEALIRWNHPTLGLLPPNQFIPVAEISGLIIPIGNWVIREACRLIQLRKQQGLVPIVISVNLAPQQLSEKELSSQIMDILYDFNIRPQQIELEITETALMDNLQIAVETLLRLRKLGMSVAIDDFGTGFSSLSQLKSLPVDTLKIDRSFIKGVEASDSDDQKIVQAILAMAQELDLLVVAEGVETPRQLEFLKTHQCARLQGFLFDKPLSEREMITYNLDFSHHWKD